MKDGGFSDDKDYIVVDGKQYAYYQNPNAWDAWQPMQPKQIVTGIDYTNMSLVEWLRDLVTYTTWNNGLSGSSDYYTLSGSYNGIIPAESIKDFRAYKNGFAAPDYYNYIAYDNGLIQIRKNNYNNTLVNQLTALTNNADKLNIYSIDTNGTDLYVLASLNLGGGTSPASVYRYFINNTGNLIIPTNQVGGAVGNLTDSGNFSVQPLPNSIKAIPLSGEKIRGFRANVLVLDEFLLLPEDIIKNVLMPFLIVPQDIKERISIREQENELIAQGAMTEADRMEFKNTSKMIALSSASYTFENLYKTYKEWCDNIYSMEYYACNNMLCNVIICIYYQLLRMSPITYYQLSD